MTTDCTLVALAVFAFLAATSWALYERRALQKYREQEVRHG